MRTIALVWAAIASLLLLRLAYRHLRLFRLLGDRRQVVEGGLAEMLAELRRNAGIWRPVWLAASPSCPTPLALGASEICVPERFVNELQREEQRAALAHELAHIARRDPLWHLVAGIIESVLFFQPLNRLARLRMRDAAEHLCDDWAVDHVGSEIGLARCLAAVASWIAPGKEPIPMGTMAMAEGGSPLLVRVQRLLERRKPSGMVPVATRRLVSFALLALLVGSAPVIITGEAAEAPPVIMSAIEDLPDEHDPDPTPSPASGLSSNVIDDVIADAMKALKDAQAGSGRLAAESVAVIRVGQRGTMEEQWDRARDEASRRGHRSYWIAWTVPSVVPRGQTVLHDSRGWNLNELQATPIASVLGVEDETDRVRGDASAAVIMLKLFIPPTDITQIERISVRTASAGMRFGGPVFWLGTPPVSDSRRWLAHLLVGLGRNAQSRAIVAAVAVHRDTSVVSWLNTIIEDDKAMWLHTEAIEGLAWHPSDVTLARLIELANDAPLPEMRREAIESIGRMRHPRAAEALRGLARTVDEPRIRRQVVESMGDQPDATMLRALMDAAITDSDHGVRKQAAEAIGKLHPKQALEGLRSIIWNSDDPGVQLEAVEALGNVGTRGAFDELLKVIERHHDEHLVIEAVETLGAVEYDWAAPALSQVSRSHRLTAARAKAMEELGNLDRRSRDGRGGKSRNFRH